MRRITKNELESKIEYLSKLTGREWRLSQAYGGYNVTRVINAGGGESDLFRCSGHVPARELALKLSAYCQGYEDAKEVHGMSDDDR